MNESPQYPITIYYRDTGGWLKSDVYENEHDLVIGLEFTDTEEVEDAWAVKAVDNLGREVSLKIEAINLERFELIENDNA